MTENQPEKKTKIYRYANDLWCEQCILVAREIIRRSRAPQLVGENEKLEYNCCSGCRKAWGQR